MLASEIADMWMCAPARGANVVKLFGKLSVTALPDGRLSVKGKLPNGDRVKGQMFSHPMTTALFVQELLGGE